MRKNPSEQALAIAKGLARKESWTSREIAAEFNLDVPHSVGIMNVVRRTAPEAWRHPERIAPRIAMVLCKKYSGYRENPKDEKLKALGTMFKHLRDAVGQNHPEVYATALIVDPDVHDLPRHYAMAGLEKTGPVVLVAPELANKPAVVQRGVLAHELGHVVAALTIPPKRHGHDAGEREADRIAEDALGMPIYYGKDGVQRMGKGAKGVRPRPRGLR